VGLFVAAIVRLLADGRAGADGRRLDAAVVVLAVELETARTMSTCARSQMGYALTYGPAHLAGAVRDVRSSIDSTAQGSTTYVSGHQTPQLVP
jgi:hypothetical protein